MWKNQDKTKLNQNSRVGHFRDIKVPQNDIFCAVQQHKRFQFY